MSASQASGAANIPQETGTGGNGGNSGNAASWFDRIMGGIGTVSGAVSGIIGATGGGQPTGGYTGGYTGGTTTGGKDNTLLWVGGVLIGLVAVVVLVVVLKGKKTAIKTGS